MPRLARVVVPGVPHHVTQRGNNRQDVFFVDDDRRAYLDVLAERWPSKRSASSCACWAAFAVHDRARLALAWALALLRALAS